MHLAIKISLILSSVLWPVPVFAQVRADNTLGTRVQVDGDRLLIDQGYQCGSALFHSFEAFNVGVIPVYFDGAGVSQIFSRVSGTGRSRINGVLGVEGSADLFLMNPNGILFGPNAQLDISGSFLGTTADSMSWDNGVEFSAIDPQPLPLLTVQGDITLRTSNDSPIHVQSGGHELEFIDRLTFNPLEGAGEGLSGLQVGEDLTLIGGNITLEGGVLTASSSNLSLIAAQRGELTLFGSQWDTSAINRFGDIQLLDTSLVDISGMGGGSIVVTGRDVSVAGGSYILSQNSGFEPSGPVSVSGRSLIIDGVGAGETIRESESTSRLIVSTSFGDGANLSVAADNIQLLNGGAIASLTYGPADGGDIQITGENLTVSGASASSSAIDPSNIQTASLASSEGGNISISAANLNILNGGIINTTNLSPPPILASTGDIEIDANSIRVEGRNPLNHLSSTILASTVQQGFSGDVSIDTSNLFVLDGGFLGTNSLGARNPGSVDIVAEQIVVSGFSTIPANVFEDLEEEFKSVDRSIRDPADIDFDNFRNPSHLDRSMIASLFLPNLASLEEEGVPFFEINQPGDITISAEQLTVENLAFISVVNTASGEAGDINLEVNDITLDRGGLSADLISGGIGGNISIDSNLLIVSNRSIISASASSLFSSTTSDGGNLNIQASNILTDSVLRANGEAGRGGIVSLSGDFLLRHDTVIEATSSISPAFDGVVEINAAEFYYDPTLFLSIPDFVPDILTTTTCGKDGGPSLQNGLAINLRRSQPISRPSSVPLWVPGSAATIEPNQLDNTVMEASRIIQAQDGTVHVVLGITRDVSVGCLL